MLTLGQYQCVKKIAVLAVFFSATAATTWSCVTPQTQAGLFVVVIDGRTVHRGAAAYTVRDGSDPESVVSLAGIGEVLVRPGRCRFVRADAGLAALSILDREGACAEMRGDRICFDAVQFGANVRVDGCADRNELFLEQYERESGFGPRTLIDRCVEIPGDVHYVRVDDITVDDVERPRRGLRFRWNGDGFDVCFLSKKSGQWRLQLTVDDAPVTLSGDVSDL